MATLRSEEYWEARAAARMEEAQLDAQETLAKLNRAYRSASASMLVQIRAMIRSFGKRYGLSEEEAAEILKKPASKESLEALKKAVAQMPDSLERRRMLAEINAPSARFRISNTQAMREQAQAVCSRMAQEEQNLFTDSLTRTISETWLKTEYDIQKGTGIFWKTTGISDRVIRQLLREDWSGATYRTRIMGRYADLGRELSTLILESMIGGRSKAAMVEEMQHRFVMCANDAKQLLTTETTYVLNAAKMEKYREQEVKEYRYMAIMDLKTSQICQDLDGMIFKVADAKAGKNSPPMHPNCRSTTIGVYSREWLAGRGRSALDPVTGEMIQLPPGTTYRDWYRLMVEKHGEKLLRAAKQPDEVAIASPRYLNKHDRLFINAERVKPIEGYEDIAVHGDEYGFIFRDADGNESRVSVVEFAQILREDKNYHGGAIRLLSCSTAAEGAITAQALADELGVEIMAPTGKVHVYPDGEMVIWEDEDLKKSGKWVIIKPKKGGREHG